MDNKKYTSLPSSMRKQQGMTMWSLVLSLGIAVFFAYILLKLVPVYTENRSVKGAMSRAFEQDENIRSLNRNVYIKAVQRQLFLDEAHRGIKFDKLIKFNRDKNGFVATLKYAKVVPLFFNISLKVDFDEKATKSVQ